MMDFRADTLNWRLPLPCDWNCVIFMLISSPILISASFHAHHIVSISPYCFHSFSSFHDCSSESIISLLAFSVCWSPSSLSSLPFHCHSISHRSPLTPFDLKFITIDHQANTYILFCNHQWMLRELYVLYYLAPYDSFICDIFCDIFMWYFCDTFSWPHDLLAPFVYATYPSADTPHTIGLCYLFFSCACYSFFSWPHIYEISDSSYCDNTTNALIISTGVKQIFLKDFVRETDLDNHHLFVTWPLVQSRR